MVPKNILDDIELRSESVQQVLSNPPAWIVRYGISIIFALILLFVVGCWFVNYNLNLKPKAVNSRDIVCYSSLYHVPIGTTLRNYWFINRIYFIPSLIWGRIV